MKKEEFFDEQILDMINQSEKKNLINENAFSNEDNNPVEQQLPIEGKLCEPKLAAQWMGAQEDTLVEGEPALNVNCSITCSYGGTIGFMDSGQEVY